MRAHTAHSMEFAVGVVASTHIEQTGRSHRTWKELVVIISIMNIALFSDSLFR